MLTPVAYSRFSAISILSSACPFLSVSLIANILPERLDPTYILPSKSSAICLGESISDANIEMLNLESIKQRLSREQNLSFLEFNYMITQAYDYYYLNKEYMVVPFLCLLME